MKPYRVLPLLLTGALFAPIASASWTRSWVIEWYEPAMYFGGTNGDILGPGTDCPDGIHEIDWLKVLMDAGYTREEAEWIRNPENPTRSPLFGQPQMAFRGKHRENVYIHPESTPESGELKPVAGGIGEGLDLDGDKTNGFVSPSGEKGIDNNYYKAVGCWKSYRGPPRMSSNAQNLIDGMRNGAWTVVIVASGAGNDPLNEPNAKLGFYTSRDRLVKDGVGGISPDYTFRVQPSAHGEGIFDAKVVQGKIITATAPEVWIWDPDRDGGEMQLLQAKAELTIQPNGALKGYLGGYRDWMKTYNGWLKYIAPSMELLSWVRLPDVWYSWRRFADYSPTGPGGERTHISSAFRIDAVPAYVATPDAVALVAQPKSFKELAPPKREAMRSIWPMGDYDYRDGIVFRKELGPVSQTAEQLRPPPKDKAETSDKSSGG